MKELVGAFNQEKALVGAFSVIVKTGGALQSTSADPSSPWWCVWRCPGRGAGRGRAPGSASRPWWAPAPAATAWTRARPAPPARTRSGWRLWGRVVIYNIYTHTGGCCPSPDFTHDVQQSLLKQHCAEIDIETATARTPAATCPHKHTAAHRHQHRHPGASNLLSTSS